MKRISVKENLGNFMNRHATIAALCAISMLMIAGQVFAADALWNTIATLIQTWVTRLGGVVMFVGGVMFGLGWKNDDADGKTRGINTIIAGAIVVAVAGLSSQFFS